MSTPEQPLPSPDKPLPSLEQRLQQLERQVLQLQQTLQLVGDVQLFAHLRQLLEAGDLDGADRETALLLEQMLASTAEGPSPEALAHCPAAPLQIIDALWRANTAGRQGFAVQQRLYQELGGNRNSLIAQDADLFHRFSERVGWPLLAGVGFALPEQLSVPNPTALDEEGQPPAGHLPLRCWASNYGLKAANLLMARLIEVFGR